MNIKKFTSLLTTFCFLVSFAGQNLAWAAPDGTSGKIGSAEFKKIFENIPKIPTQYGKITAVSNKGSKSIVVNIQDLHCHPEAQKNIGKIIEILDKNYKVQKIYVEGAYGKIDIKWLADIQDKSLRDALILQMVEDGRLNASEYYAVKNNKKDFLVGLEDKARHEENIKRLGYILNQQQKYDEVFSLVQNNMDYWDAKYTNIRNKRFNRTIEKYRRGEIGAEKFYAILCKYMNKINENPQNYNNVLPVKLSNYPNIQNFLFATKANSELDMKKVELQLQALLAYLKAKLPIAAFQIFLDETDNLSNIDRLTAALSNFGTLFDINLDINYKELNAFFKLQNLSKTINPLALLDEERHLTERLRAALSYDQTEIEISFLNDFSGYFRDYLQNKLMANDFAYFDLRVEKFKELYSKYAIVNDLQSIEEDFEILNAYYRLNDKRNDIFADNILKYWEFSPWKMENTVTDNPDDLFKNSEEIIIVVTGGYHSHGLKELLAKKGITDIIITPTITTDIEHAEFTYKEMIKQQSIFLREALAFTIASQAGDQAQFEALVLAGISFLKNSRYTPDNIDALVKTIQSAVHNSDIKISDTKNEDETTLLFRDGKSITIKKDDKGFISLKNEGTVFAEDKPAARIKKHAPQLLKEVLSFIPSMIGTSALMPDLENFLKEFVKFADNNKFHNFFTGTGLIMNADAYFAGKTDANIYGIDKNTFGKLPEQLQKIFFNAHEEEQQAAPAQREVKKTKGTLWKIAASIIIAVGLFMTSTSFSEGFDANAPRAQQDRFFQNEQTILRIFPNDIIAALRGSMMDKNNNLGLGNINTSVDFSNIAETQELVQEAYNALEKGGIRFSERYPVLFLKGYNERNAQATAKLKFLTVSSDIFEGFATRQEKIEFLMLNIAYEAEHIKHTNLSALESERLAHQKKADAMKLIIKYSKENLALQQQVADAFEILINNSKIIENIAFGLENSLERANFDHFNYSNILTSSDYNQQNEDKIPDDSIVIQLYSMKVDKAGETPNFNYFAEINTKTGKIVKVKAVNNKTGETSLHKADDGKLELLDTAAEADSKGLKGIKRAFFVARKEFLPSLQNGFAERHISLTKEIANLRKTGAIAIKAATITGAVTGMAITTALAISLFSFVSLPALIIGGAAGAGILAGTLGYSFNITTHAIYNLFASKGSELTLQSKTESLQDWLNSLKKNKPESYRKTILFIEAFIFKDLSVLSNSFNYTASQIAPILEKLYELQDSATKQKFDELVFFAPYTGSPHYSEIARNLLGAIENAKTPKDISALRPLSGKVIELRIKTLEQKLSVLGIKNIPTFAIRSVSQQYYKTDPDNPYGKSPVYGSILHMTGISPSNFMEVRDNASGTEMFIKMLRNTFQQMPFGNDIKDYFAIDLKQTPVFIAFNNGDYILNNAIYSNTTVSYTLSDIYSSVNLAVSEEVNRWYSQSGGEATNGEMFSVMLTQEEVNALIAEVNTFINTDLENYLKQRNVSHDDEIKKQYFTVLMSRYINTFLYEKYLTQLVGSTEKNIQNQSKLELPDTSKEDLSTQIIANVLGKNLGAKVVNVDLSAGDVFDGKQPSFKLLEQKIQTNTDKALPYNRDGKVQTNILFALSLSEDDKKALRDLRNSKDEDRMNDMVNIFAYFLAGKLKEVNKNIPDTDDEVDYDDEDSDSNDAANSLSEIIRNAYVHGNHFDLSKKVYLYISESANEVLIINEDMLYPVPLAKLVEAESFGAYGGGVGSFSGEYRKAGYRFARVEIKDQGRAKKLFIVSIALSDEKTNRDILLNKIKPSEQRSPLEQWQMRNNLGRNMPTYKIPTLLPGQQTFVLDRSEKRQFTIANIDGKYAIRNIMDFSFYESEVEITEQNGIYYLRGDLFRTHFSEPENIADDNSKLELPLLSQLNNILRFFGVSERNRTKITAIFEVGFTSLGAFSPAFKNRFIRWHGKRQTEDQIAKREEGMTSITNAMTDAWKTAADKAINRFAFIRLIQRYAFGIAGAINANIEAHVEYNLANPDARLSLSGDSSEDFDPAYFHGTSGDNALQVLKNRSLTRGTTSMGVYFTYKTGNKKSIPKYFQVDDGYEAAYIYARKKGEQTVIFGFTGVSSRLGKKGGHIGPKRINMDSDFQHPLTGDEEGNIRLSEISFQTVDDMTEFLEKMSEQNIPFPEGVSIRIRDVRTDESRYISGEELKDLLKENGIIISDYSTSTKLFHENKNVSDIINEASSNFTPSKNARRADINRSLGELASYIKTRTSIIKENDSYIDINSADSLLLDALGLLFTYLSQSPDKGVNDFKLLGFDAADADNLFSAISDFAQIHISQQDLRDFAVFRLMKPFVDASGFRRSDFIGTAIATLKVKVSDISNLYGSDAQMPENVKKDLLSEFDIVLGYIGSDKQNLVSLENFLTKENIPNSSLLEALEPVAHKIRQQLAPWYVDYLLKDRIALQNQQFALDRADAYQNSICELDLRLARFAGFIDSLPQETKNKFRMAYPRGTERYFEIMTRAGDKKYLYAVFNNLSGKETLHSRLFALMYLKAMGEEINTVEITQEYRSVMQKFAVANDFDLRASLMGTHLLLSSKFKPFSEIEFSDFRGSKNMNLFEKMSRAIITQPMRAKDGQVQGGANSGFIFDKNNTSVEIIAHELGHNYLYALAPSLYSNTTPKGMFHELFAYTIEGMILSLLGKHVPYKNSSLEFDLFEGHNKQEQKIHSTAKGFINLLQTAAQTPSYAFSWLHLADAAVKFAQKATDTQYSSQSYALGSFLKEYSEYVADVFMIDSKDVLNGFKLHTSEFGRLILERQNHINNKPSTAIVNDNYANALMKTDYAIASRSVLSGERELLLQAFTSEEIEYFDVMIHSQNPKALIKIINASGNIKHRLFALNLLRLTGNMDKFDGLLRDFAREMRKGIQIDNNYDMRAVLTGMHAALMRNKNESELFTQPAAIYYRIAQASLVNKSGYDRTTNLSQMYLTDTSAYAMKAALRNQYIEHTHNHSTYKPLGQELISTDFENLTDLMTAPGEFNDHSYHVTDEENDRDSSAAVRSAAYDAKRTIEEERSLDGIDPAIIEKARKATFKLFMTEGAFLPLANLSIIEFEIDGKKHKYMLASSHALKYANRNNVEFTAGDDENNNKKMKTKIVFDSPSLDIALLEVPKAIDHIEPLTMSLTPAKQGDRLFSLGYPFDEEFMSAGYVQNENAYKGILSTLKPRDGTCGSAVFNMEGEIIGIRRAWGKNEALADAFKINDKDEKNKPLFPYEAPISMIYAFLKTSLTGKEESRTLYLEGQKAFDMSFAEDIVDSRYFYSTDKTSWQEQTVKRDREDTDSRELSVYNNMGSVSRFFKDPAYKNGRMELIVKNKITNLERKIIINTDDKKIISVEEALMPRNDLAESLGTKAVIDINFNDILQNQEILNAIPIENTDDGDLDLTAYNMISEKVDKMLTPLLSGKAKNMLLSFTLSNANENSEKMKAKSVKVAALVFGFIAEKLLNAIEKENHAMTETEKSRAKDTMLEFLLNALVHGNHVDMTKDIQIYIGDNLNDYFIINKADGEKTSLSALASASKIGVHDSGQGSKRPYFKFSRTSVNGTDMFISSSFISPLLDSSRDVLIKKINQKSKWEEGKNIKRTLPVFSIPTLKQGQQVEVSVYLRGETINFFIENINGKLRIKGLALDRADKRLFEILSEEGLNYITSQNSSLSFGKIMQSDSKQVITKINDPLASLLNDKLNPKNTLEIDFSKDFNFNTMQTADIRRMVKAALADKINKEGLGETLISISFTNMPTPNSEAELETYMKITDDFINALKDTLAEGLSRTDPYVNERPNDYDNAMKTDNFERSAFEFTKNAFSHGNHFDLSKNIYLYVGKDAGEIYFINTISDDKTNEKVLAAATAKGLYGGGIGAQDSVDYSFLRASLGKQEIFIANVFFDYPQYSKKDVIAKTFDSTWQTSDNLGRTLPVFEIPQLNNEEGVLVTAVNNENNDIKFQVINTKGKIEISGANAADNFSISQSSGKYYLHSPYFKTTFSSKQKMTKQQPSNTAESAVNLIKEKLKPDNTYELDLSKVFTDFKRPNYKELNKVLQADNMLTELATPEIRKFVEALFTDKNSPIKSSHSLQNTFISINLSKLKLEDSAENFRLASDILYLLANYLSENIVQKTNLKYEKTTVLRDALFESLKNAFTHGNGLDLSKPISIYINEEGVFVINSESNARITLKQRSLISKLKAFLFGQGLGVTEIYNSTGYKFARTKITGASGDSQEIFIASLDGDMKKDKTLKALNPDAAWQWYYEINRTDSSYIVTDIPQLNEGEEIPGEADENTFTLLKQKGQLLITDFRTTDEYKPAIPTPLTLDEKFEIQQEDGKFYLVSTFRFNIEFGKPYKSDLIRTGIYDKDANSINVMAQKQKGNVFIGAAIFIKNIPKIIATSISSLFSTGKTHQILVNYHFIRQSGIVSAVREFGSAATLTPEGYVNLPVYVVNSKPLNHEEFDFANTAISINGKPLWISKAKGAVVVYSEGASELAISQELSSNRKINTLIKQNVQSEIKTNLKNISIEWIEVDHSDTGKGISYSDDGNIKVGYDLFKHMLDIGEMLDFTASLRKVKNTDGFTLAQGILHYLDDINSREDFVEYLTQHQKIGNGQIVVNPELAQKIIDEIGVQKITAFLNTARKDGVQVFLLSDSSQMPLRFENAGFAGFLYANEATGKTELFNYAHGTTTKVKTIDTISSTEALENDIKKAGEPVLLINSQLRNIINSEKSGIAIGQIIDILSSFKILKMFTPQKMTPDFAYKAAMNFDISDMPEISPEKTNEIMNLYSAGNFAGIIAALDLPQSHPISIYITKIKSQTHEKDVYDTFVTAIIEKCLTAASLRKVHKPLGLQDKTYEVILGRALLLQTLEKTEGKGVSIDHNALGKTMTEAQAKLFETLHSLMPQAFENKDPKAINALAELIPAIAEERRKRLTKDDIKPEMDMKNYESILAAA